MKTIQLKSVNANEVMNDEAGKYNPAIWAKKVNSLLEMDPNAKFFQVMNETRYSSNEFLCSYKTTDGLMVVKRLSFTTTLSNQGFFQCLFVNCDENFKSIVEYINEGNAGFVNCDDKMILHITEFNFGGEKGLAENTESNRSIFIKNNTVVSNESFLFLK